MHCGGAFHLSIMSGAAEHACFSDKIAEAAWSRCRHQRDAVKAELQKLLKALRKRGALVGKAFIITARVPIIKCTLAGSGNQHIPADISLGVANGLSAVAFIEQQVRPMPPHHSPMALQQILMFAAIMATACFTNVSCTHWYFL